MSTDASDAGYTHTRTAKRAISSAMASLWADRRSAAQQLAELAGELKSGAERDPAAVGRKLDSIHARLRLERRPAKTAAAEAEELGAGDLARALRKGQR